MSASWREFRERLRFALDFLRDNDGDLVTHARRESEFMGNDEMGLAMRKHIVDMTRAFCVEGHSGMSAGYAISALQKILRYEPIRPLTGEPDEWTEVGHGVFQNIRCSHVFRDDSEYEGQAYDIDGRVFREPNGSCYTNQDSRVLITFPYTPKTEYVDVSE